MYDEKRFLTAKEILDKDFKVHSAVNCPNTYNGPKTGYQVEGERWEEIKNINNAKSPEDY